MEMFWMRKKGGQTVLTTEAHEPHLLRQGAVRVAGPEEKAPEPAKAEVETPKPARTATRSSSKSSD